MGKIIDKAVSWIKATAKDNSHGYANEESKRYGPDYDCSSLVTSAWVVAGVKIQLNGTKTYNMRERYKKAGFKDVTKKVNLKTCEGMQPGDVLVHEGTHTAMYVGNNKMTHARINEKGQMTGGKTGDQTGSEIKTSKYSNMSWNLVLRYVEPKPEPDKPKQKVFRVQVGVFVKENKMSEKAKEIKSKTDFDCFFETSADQYFLFCGSFEQKDKATERMNILQENGIQCFIKEVEI